MTGEKVSLARLWALMLTVFVDMIGFLMIVPLLPIYATRLGASAFLVGLMISTFAAAQLATSPTWGKLSDRHGRRPMLLFGITISIAAHLLFALACSNWAMDRFASGGLIALLFLSRFVQGAGGATTGVVQAYVGDTVVPEDRAQALGWISAATAAGVMVGPTIGSLASLAGPAMPGIAAAMLGVVNLGLARRLLPESRTHEERWSAATKPRAPLRQRMIEISTHPNRPVARLVWVYAAGMMGFMAMNAVLALYLQAQFAFTEKSIGYIYTFIGMVGLVMRSLLLGPAVRRFGEIGAMRIGLLSLASGFVLTPLAASIWSFVVVAICFPVGTALLFPATSSLVSRYSTRHELGATMGVQQAYGGMARLIGPIWAGAAFQAFGPGAPFWISAGLVLATLLFAQGLAPPPISARGAPSATDPATG